MTDKALYFFGPPQIVVDSENIKLSRKKAIALLAYLAVNDQSYSRDALAVLLWPESGQSQARAALRRTLSYLRTNLEEDWLEEGADLVVSLNRKADIWVDVVEFRNLVANSQLQECTHLSLNEIDRLQKATELYQGDFLAGFSLRDTPEYDEWQFFHAETLCQDLAKVLGCLVQAYANDHQFDQAITHVRRWLALDTLQEEVHRQLMLLYAWSGQRNAALRQYRICARTLADELGGDVKPTEETKKLYELVKIDRVPSLPNTNLDDSADVTAVPIPQRRWSRPLAGRQEEMAQLRTALKESLQGKGNLLLLSGEAGIGKTRLVLELARQAQSEGVLFLMGRAYEQDQGAPYRPWRELINTFISWASSEATSMAVAELGPELARLAPSLAEEPSPTTMTGPNPAQRFQFFEAVTQFFINISRQRLLLLFLDDIHWSEEASLQLLQYVAAKTRQEKILLIVAYRDVELEKRRKLWAIITQMNRERLFTLIHLARLPQGDVKEIIEYYLKGKVATELERIVYQKTDGNPFFVEELLLYLQREDALIRREEGWDIKAADTIQIPGAIGAVFEERLERFPQLLLDLLKWAAVIGTEFAFPLLQSVSGQSEDQLIEQIEVALAEKLIVERRIPGEEIFVFADEVIREVIYENISVIRRRRYHLLVGEAIEAIYHDALDSWVEQLSYHFLEGNDLEKAIQYAIAAGDKAMKLYAWEDAIQRYETTLELLPQDRKHQQASLFLKLADAYIYFLDYDTAVQLAENALTIYEECGDRQDLTAAHFRLTMLYDGINWDGAKEYRALKHLEKLASLGKDLPDSKEKGLVYQRIAHGYLHLGNPANALTWSRRAKELFENLGVHMGTAMGTALAYKGDIDAGVEYSLSNWEGVRALGDPIILSLFGHELVLTLTLARDMPRAIAWGEKVLPILTQASELAAGQLRRPLALAYALSGKMTQGVSLCQAEEEFESKSLIGCYFESGAGVGLFHIRHGDWDKAKTYLERMKEIQKGRRNFGAVSASSYCLGMMNMEQEQYNQAIDHFLESLNICRKGGNLLFTLWVLPAMVELQIKLDKLNVARDYLDECFELLEPDRNWCGLPGDTYRVNGILTTKLEEWEEAEASFKKAVMINRNYEMPWDEAKTHYEWGKMLLHRNARGDKTVAEERFSQALTLFEEVEAQKEIEKVNLALEKL